MPKGWVQERLPHGIEAPRQLGGIDPVEPLEHDAAPALAILDHQRADLGERGARHRRPLPQFINEMKRDIQLPDGAERLREATDLALRFSGLGVLEPGGQHRQRLPQAAGGNTRLVNADVGSGNRRRQLSPQCSGAALEKADQG